MIKENSKVNSFINCSCIFVSVAIIVYQLLYLIIPIRQVLYTLHLDTISPILAVIGAVFLVADLFTQRLLFKAKYSYLLIATLVVLGVSSLVYINYGIVDSAKSIIWQAVQMLLIYPLAMRMSKETLKKLTLGLYNGFSFIYGISTLVSLILFFTGSSYYSVSIKDNVAIRQGFTEGRLFGIFSAPYFPTLICGLLIVAMPYFFKSAKYLWLKIWYCVSAVFLFLYIVLSETRSIRIALFVTAGVYGFFAVRNILNRKNYKIPVKYLACILTAVVSVSALFAVINVSDTLSKKVYVAIEMSNENPTHPQSPEKEEPEEEPPIIDPQLQLERPDINDANVSNGRFTIWKDYITATLGSPKSVLFGFSSGNYMKAIRDAHPDIYIVSWFRDHHPLLYKQDLIYDVHNSYLSAFVMSGILGVATLFGFLIICVIKVAHHLFKNKYVSIEILTLTAMITTIMCDAFFDSDLFFRCTSTSVVFWFIAGILIHKVFTESKTEE